MSNNAELLKSAGEPPQHGTSGMDATEDEEVNPSGKCGPCAGILEALSLFWTVPGFARLAAYMFTSAAGGLIPAVFYLGSLSSQVWGTNAAGYSLWINVAQFSFAIVGAPLFGMWSDSHPRKMAMTISAVGTMARTLPFLFLQNNASLWISSIITVITAPVVSQLSGSPVLWAWMTDTIPVEHRETGFGIIFGVGSLAAWISGTILSAIAKAYAIDLGVIYVWVGQVFLLLSLLLVVTAPSIAPKVSEEDPDPLSRQKGLSDVLLSPLRLVARKRSLRLICGVSAFVTLPDVAVTYIAQPIVFQILGIVGSDPQNIVYQHDLANWFSNFPNIFLIVIYAIIGVLAKRFGPSKVLVVWVPIACVLFAGPALFALQGPDDHVLQVLCGLMMSSPISIYPPLQALVALLVPPSRVGEAFGSVAACKNVASLLAPLAMQVAITAFGTNYDLYWTLFPGAALIMLAGAWPCTVMLAKRIGDGTETDGHQWSAWSEVGGSVNRSGIRSRASGMGA